uniref:Uncharacterized protein n=1 Tax=Xiphophorus couchianus TaxID=32473 RepID=A0A3B5M6K3_9TELE
MNLGAVRLNLKNCFNQQKYPQNLYFPLKFTCVLLTYFSTTESYADIIFRFILLNRIISVAMMYVIEVGCLLLSVLGVFGACKGKRWCLILSSVCLQKRVVREEAKLLAMMPLTAPNKANRTLLHNIQEELECCGLIEGYKDWGASIPASCNCHYPGKCVMENNINNTQINILFTPFMLPCCFIPQPCLPIYLSELKLAFSLVMAIQFGSGVFWVTLLLYHIHIKLPLPCSALSE